MVLARRARKRPPGQCVSGSSRKTLVLCKEKISWEKQSQRKEVYLEPCSKVLKYILEQRRWLFHITNWMQYGEPGFIFSSYNAASYPWKALHLSFTFISHYWQWAHWVFYSRRQWKVFGSEQHLAIDSMKLDDDAPMGLINYPLNLIFSQCNVILGDGLISQSSTTHPYRAMIKTLLNLSGNSLTSQFSTRLWPGYD